MPSPRNVLVAAFAVSCTALLAACGDPSRATAPSPAPAATFEAAAQPTLLECPSDTTIRATGTIGLLGGTISAGRTSIKFPVGAVLVPTQFELVVPASRYMEIEAHAVGREHHQFVLPVSVTIDFARCAPSVIEQGGLSVYYIDGSSKSLLERMGGIFDLVGQQATFSTDHFSGYAIAS